MRKAFQDSFWKVNFLDIVTVVILAIGAIIGYKAFYEYKKLNAITFESSLMNYDRELNNMLINKKELQSIYAIPPKISNLKEKASYQVNICISNLKKQNNIVWKDVPDLYEKFWEYDGFHDEHKYLLRETYCYCENIITILLNAYWIFKEEVITPESWNTWLGSINEIGSHPIFLCALYGCVKDRYIDDEFAEYIKNEILKIPSNKEIIKSIYKDMLEHDWIARIRK